MNGKYYQNPTFPQNIEEVREEQFFNNEFVMENNYLHLILKDNKGKKVKVYSSFPYATEWKNKLFEGVIENSEKDFLIISDPKNGEWNIIPVQFIDYINFEERIK